MTRILSLLFALTLLALPASSAHAVLSINDDNGDEFAAGTDAIYKAPTRWLVSFGTTGSPDTSVAPIVGMYQVQNYSAGNCASSVVDLGCGATLQVHVKNTSSSAIQPVGVLGAATTSSNIDSIGVAGTGLSTGSSTEKGTGGYFVGRRDHSTGKAGGVELQVQNDVNSDCNASGAFPDNCVGALLSYNDRGFGKKGGVAVLAATAATAHWQVGFQCQYASEACFRDFGTTGVYGMDLSAATYSNGAIKLATGTSGKVLWAGGTYLYEPVAGALTLIGSYAVSGSIMTVTGYYTNGVAGLSTTKTVRNSADTSSCTLVFSGGILTGGTC